MTSATSLRTWTIQFPAPAKFLTANDKRHWSKKGDDIQAWRAAVVAACRQAHLPQDVAKKVRVDVTYRFRGRPPVRDTGNLAPNSKALVDGLTPHRVVQTKKGPKVHIGYGLIPDDARRWVDGPHDYIGDPLPKQAYGPLGEVEITVTELAKES